MLYTMYVTSTIILKHRKSTLFAFNLPRFQSTYVPYELGWVIPHISKRMLLLFPLFPLMGNGGEWGKWNIIKEYRLLSLAKQPQAGSLDIGHTKAPSVRKYLYVHIQCFSMLGLLATIAHGTSARVVVPTTI